MVCVCLFKMFGTRKTNILTENTHKLLWFAYVRLRCLEQVKQNILDDLYSGDLPWDEVKKKRTQDLSLAILAETWSPKPRCFSEFQVRSDICKRRNIKHVHLKKGSALCPLVGNYQGTLSSLKHGTVHVLNDHFFNIIQTQMCWNSSSTRVS